MFHQILVQGLIRQRPPLCPWKMTCSSRSLKSGKEIRFVKTAAAKLILGADSPIQVRTEFQCCSTSSDRTRTVFFKLMSRCAQWAVSLVIFFFQAEDGIRDFCLSRGLGDVYKRQGEMEKNMIQGKVKDKTIQYKDTSFSWWGKRRHTIQLPVLLLPPFPLFFWWWRRLDFF